MSLGLWKQVYPETRWLRHWSLGLLSAPETLPCTAKKYETPEGQQTTKSGLDYLESSAKSQVRGSAREASQAELEPLRFQFMLKGEL